MKMTQELSEKIEGYIEGSLSETELADFDKMLLENPELQEKIEIQKDIQAALKNQKSIDFRKKLVQINQDLDNKTQNKKVSIPSYWKIAASFLVLIGLTTFLWFNNNSSKDLFAAYYTPYPIGDIKRGATNLDDPNFKSVVLEYKNKEYKKVIPALEDLVSAQPNNETLKLSLGNAYLNTNQLDKSVKIFEEFLATSKFYNDAQWFLALTYLKMDQEPTIIPILEGLISQNTKYKNTATDLLKDIALE